MSILQLFSAVGLPLMMAVGAIAAWRMTRKENTTSIEQPAWRDTSLDDWRKERDAEADSVRAARLEGEPHEGAAAEEKSETKRHQRIGG